MRYFEFSNSIEIKEIGKSDQTSLKNSEEYNPNGENGIWKFKYDEFPNFIPKIGLQLNKGANLTDILRSPEISFGFVVSKKVKTILERFKVVDHKFYPVKIYLAKDYLEYYWFHPITNGFMDWVDRSKTKLVLRHIMPHKRDEIVNIVDLTGKIEICASELWNTKPPLTDYYWENLTFNEQFPGYDLFETASPSSALLINDILKEALENAEVTGCRFNEFGN